MASKPVANTIESSRYSASLVLKPCGVISAIGDVRTSTSVTFGRLNVS